MNNEQNIVKNKTLINKKMKKAINLYNQFNKPKVKKLSVSVYK